ncbi:MAG: hypothetical protein IH605_19625 [Burkholderiales bacterium]|nr:hypothetical protein [Burkholderiales bacterium]
MFILWIDPLRKLGIFALLTMLMGCSGIPQHELDSYVSSFKTAKSTTQDIILNAKNSAEKANDGTNVGRQTLAQRQRALDARLAALDLIDKYNDILVKLATGTDAAAVKGSLEGLSTNLKSFGVAQLTSFAAQATPYFGIISKAVGLIDDSIKAEKFNEAVSAAQDPIQAIIGILREDADDLGEIQTQLLAMKQDPERDQLLDLYFKFAALSNGLIADADVGKAITDLNLAWATLSIDPAKRPIAVAPVASGGRAATAADKAVLQTIVSQTAARVAAYNKIGDQIRAEGEVTEAYKGVLEATSRNFADLNVAIAKKREMAPISFAINVLNLRKAYLALQEAK